MSSREQDVARVIRLVFERCWEEFYLGRREEMDVLPGRMREQASSSREKQLQDLMDLDGDESQGEVASDWVYSGEPFDGETDLDLLPSRDSARPVVRTKSTQKNGSKGGSRIFRSSLSIWKYDSGKTAHKSRKIYPDARPAQDLPERRKGTALAGAATEPAILTIRHKTPLLRHRRVNSDDPQGTPTLASRSTSPLIEFPSSRPRRSKPVVPVPEYTFCVPIEETIWVPEEVVMPFLPTMPEEAGGNFDYDKYGELLYQGEYAWEAKDRDPDLDIILVEVLKRLGSPAYMRRHHNVSAPFTTANIDESGMLPQLVGDIHSWEDVRDLPSFPARMIWDKGVPRPTGADGDDEAGAEWAACGSSMEGSSRRISGSGFQGRSTQLKRRKIVLSDDEEIEPERGPPNLTATTATPGNPSAQDPFSTDTTLTTGGPPRRRSDILDFDEVNCPNGACREFGCALHVADATGHILPALETPVPPTSAKAILLLRPNECSAKCFYRDATAPSESLSTLSFGDQSNLHFLLAGLGKDGGEVTVCDLTLLLGNGQDSADSTETSVGVDVGNGTQPTCSEVGQYIEAVFADQTPRKPLGFTPTRPNQRQRHMGEALTWSPSTNLMDRPRIPIKPKPPTFDLQATHMEPVELCHHPGPCNADVCRCFAARIHCERDCTCGLDYVRRHPGCRCKAEPGNGKKEPCTEPNRCPCRRDGRECDPSLCGTCGADHEDSRPKDRKVGRTSLPGLCTNICIQAGHSQPIRVGVSPISGYGLFADAAIKKNLMILEYVGELLNYNEGAKRGMIYEVTHRNYLFDLNKIMHIDAAHRGNVGRYINGGRKNTVNTVCYVSHVQGNHRIAMFASRDIKAGEELLFDYGEHFNLSSQNDPKLLQKKRKAKAVKQQGQKDAAERNKKTSQQTKGTTKPAGNAGEVSGTRLSDSQGVDREGAARRKTVYYPEIRTGRGYFRGLKVI